VLHDVALYNWQLSSRLSMREFIRQNRRDIDRHIDDVMSNEKPAYLAYGTIMWAKVLDLVFYGMIAIGMAMVIWGWL